MDLRDREQNALTEIEKTTRVRQIQKKSFCSELKISFAYKKLLLINLIYFNGFSYCDSLGGAMCPIWLTAVLGLISAICIFLILLDIKMILNSCLFRIFDDKSDFYHCSGSLIAV